MTTTPPPLDFKVGRCNSCGLWKITDRPCPNCSRDGEGFRSHRWIDPRDGEAPYCADCLHKVWHAGAWWTCEGQV